MDVDGGTIFVGQHELRTLLQAYRPRTSRYDLPEIMSGVAPSGFGNRERRDEGDMDVDSELLARRASLTRPEA
jgi:hypothetical protein